MSEIWLALFRDRDRPVMWAIDDRDPDGGGGEGDMRYNFDATRRDIERWMHARGVVLALIAFGQFCSRATVALGPEGAEHG